MRQKFLVIGSNSFSGNDFIDLVLNDPDTEVIGVSRSPESHSPLLAYKTNKNLNHFKFHQMDLNKDLGQLIELIQTYKPLYVVNFAAQSEVLPSWENPQHWYQTNVIALSTLVHHLRDAKFLKRFVQISSPEVYGPCRGRVTEEETFNPSTPYAASKAAGDLALMVYAKNFNFPLIIVRATNVYGPRQQLFKIIPRTFIYIKNKKLIDLHGGGLAIKSFIHIRDVSHGELAVALRGQSGETYHISPDHGYAVRDIIRRICQLMEVGFESVTRTVEERLGQDSAYVIDSTKIRRELERSPKIDIDTGLVEVMRWINQHWAWIQKQPLHYIHRP